MCANQWRACLQPLQRMLQIAMANSSGPNHQRAIGNGLGYRLVFFRAGQQVRRAHGRTRSFKCHIVGIHQPQMLKSKVAHRPSGRADVEGIARVHQDNAQTSEFSRKRQAVGILRQDEFVASHLPQPLFTWA